MATHLSQTKLVDKQYSTGLVLGKFMPIHTGHIALIDFASGYVEKLIVLVCGKDGEAIEGLLRYGWVVELYKNNPCIQVVYMDYGHMPDSKRSNKNVSAAWASYIKKEFPEVEAIFSSEKYGDYVAEYAHIDHVLFDQRRRKNPVSGTKIRNNPFAYWDWIPHVVKPYFMKKIILVGGESSGKSTLTKRLAAYYNTDYVPEMARDIVSVTGACTYEDMYKIAELHARTIIHKSTLGSKLLFIDTDITITHSYSTFLFGKDFSHDQWIYDANKGDLYLYLDSDAPFVQDGTRLNKTLRKKLDTHHKKTFAQHGIQYYLIQGSWEERFHKAIKIVNKLFFSHTANINTLSNKKSVILGTFYHTKEANNSLQ